MTESIWMPPPPHGTKDGWHVLIVRDLPEDDDVDEHGQERVTLLHPEGCALHVHSSHGVRYDCHTASDVSAGDYCGMFERDETLRPGIWLVHPWVEKIRGADWTEYDGGWTVIRLSEASYEP